MIKNEKLIVSLHEEAERASKEIRQKEWDLIVILQQVIKHEVYRKYKYPSLLKYLTLSLELSEYKAQEYSVVARSSLRFEKLKLALESGKISVSKARRIAPVLTKENQDEWINKARLSTHRHLEKLVAAQNPEAAFNESSRYISANQIEVKMIMTVKEFEYFKRAQDLLCQKQKKPVSMKNTLVQTAKDYIEKQDPVIKAVRHQTRELKKAFKNKQSGTCQMNQTTGNKGFRESVPRITFYQVQLRDKGQCQDILPNGEKCGESKWIDIHHIKPISHGGDNSLQNLVTLCKGHHQLEHWTSQ